MSNVDFYGLCWLMENNLGAPEIERKLVRKGRP